MNDTPSSNNTYNKIKPIYTKEFRLYRPNKSGNGTAVSLQLSNKPNNKYDKWMCFLMITQQIGLDDKGNAKFDWDGALTVKLGENDLGELMAVLEGRQASLGFKGSLFHQTPKGGNKIIKLDKNKEKGGFYLSVSAQGPKKEKLGNYYQVISNGEGSMMLVLLKRAVEKIFGW